MSSKKILNELLADNKAKLKAVESKINKSNASILESERERLLLRIKRINQAIKQHENRLKNIDKHKAVNADEDDIKLAMGFMKNSMMQYNKDNRWLARKREGK